jgi:hypothetical protein
MSIDRTWFAILLAVCCAPSIVVWTRVRVHDFRQTHASPGAAPLRFADACLDGVMMGAGTGLAIAAAVLVGSSAAFHLGASWLA